VIVTYGVFDNVIVTVGCSMSCVMRKVVPWRHANVMWCLCFGLATGGWWHRMSR